MKKILSLFLILALVPVAMAVCCQCAHASEIPHQLVIENVPCHGCCGAQAEMSKDCGVLTENIVAGLPQKLISPVLKDLVSASNALTVISITAEDSSPGKPDFVPRSSLLQEIQPLYLQIQTLRI